MKVKLTNPDMRKLLKLPDLKLPKYWSPIINLANGYSRATRPENVGSMTSLMGEFNGGSVEEWEEFYNKKHPSAISSAADTIKKMLYKMNNDHIDLKAVKSWVIDLIINKTYVGLNVQEAILAKISKEENLPYRQSTITEESVGIDGFIGNVPISIKPTTYKNNNLLENIECYIIYYEKKSTGIDFQYTKKNLKK
tara:strand:+ start:215 stop:799 length:585 start_codon:yes stop_codon:yes gene_type:complete